MVEEEQNITPMQVCSIQIGFPVESDEQAIEYKKKIAVILADIPKLRIDFSLMTVPALPPSSKNA